MTPSPRLPSLLTFPLRFISSTVQSTLLASLLNQVFAEAIRAGELDFLQEKTLIIQVQDANIIYSLSFLNNQLIASQSSHQADIKVTGTAYDFLCLITQREDPDSLFFNRRLQLEGSTELGLYVKNFLAAIELDKYAQFGVQQLEHCVDIFEYLWKIRTSLPLP